ncbi:hypothetical protein SUGI_0365900 [Cryptomeria japonica]|nr:hypothetical protein SUGI_0365900 [Cryptomeria japonica]
MESALEELANISSYLRDVDLQGAHDKSVKSWLLEVAEIAEIALDAEDILDECALQSQGTTNESRQSSCVYAFSYSQLVFRYKMAHRIKDMKDRTRSILKEDGKQLKFFQDLTRSNQPSTSTSQNVKWRGSSVIESSSRPVAIDSKVEEILGLLDAPVAPVIVVVGMGGVGKTSYCKMFLTEKRAGLRSQSGFLFLKLILSKSCKLLWPFEGGR